MNCFRTSNNKHFNAPQRMSDGRNFTDYRPNYELNKSLKDLNKLDNSHNYRNFLNNNAEKIEFTQYLSPKDHRIIMMTYLFMRRNSGGKLFNFQHAEKSFPDFFGVMS